MNSRTLELVELLTTKVRCLRREQVERLWFGHTKQPSVMARQYLRRVERLGLVSLAKVMNPPEAAFNEPLLNWRPGNQEPNFDRLAWQAEARLARPAAATLVIAATKKAQAFTGGPIGSRPLRSAEMAHDLMVAGVFEQFHRDFPEIAKSWTPEDALLQNLFATQNTLCQEIIPDAIVMEGNDKIAIEIAGRYSAQKLRAVHHAHAGGCYHLW